MTARGYFAWRMIVEAELEDRRAQQNHRKRMRAQVGDPIENLTERYFIKLYRISKTAFTDLCIILKEKTNLKSSQRVSLESKVLCALTFYAYGGYQRLVGESKHFSQEAISNYIKEVTDALNHPDILERFIRFPRTPEERSIIKQRFYSKYGIPGVIGCIDGCHFKIFTPNKEEEHLYYCRKHYHSLNVQMVCDSECRILGINPKFGGATHDAFIFDNSNVKTFMQNLHRDHELVWLLGDSGYPQRPWIMTPYSNPAPGSTEETYNKKHSTARVVIENTFGRLKNRWRCVCKDRVLHYKPGKCAQIIIACCVLHNMAIEYNVPDPEDMDPPSQDTFARSETILENETNELLMGRALRDQLARRL